MKAHLLFSFILLLAVGCRQVPNKFSKQSAADNKFSNGIIREIYTHKDERKTSALLPYLRHKEAGVREEAALAFASVQDSAALPLLSELLTDTEPAVRNAAAFATGQTGGRSAKVFLAEAIRKEQSPAVLATLFEAYGKVTNAAGLHLFTDNSPTDTTALAGLQWGIYRAGLRGITNAKVTAQTVQHMQPHIPFRTRLAAAHTLARTPNTDLSAWEKTLLPLAQTEPSAIIRSTLVAALSKVKSVRLASVLGAAATSDKDYRVRISAVKAMGKLPFAEVKESLAKALNDAHEQVALTAAETMLANGTAADAINIAASAEAAQNWRVRAILLQAALRLTPAKEKPALRKSIQNRYQRATNNYEKGYLLKAMSEDLESFLHISDVALNTQNPVLSTYAVEALTEMRTKENFPEGLKTIFAEVFEMITAMGDVAAAGTVATAIRNPAGGLKNDFSSFTFLEKARDKLTLPRDMETYIEMQKTLDFVTGTTTAAPKTPFTHPVNWQIVQSIPVGQKVRISTSKGEIVLQLNVNDAPGSVANFVDLTRKGFYNGKTIHRVAPNFVVQDGCPRGDGWGSTDYNIRSEFALNNFITGSAGLASAGKDTESCQWFITHTATPHLDGRYTNFAQVIKGMDVVHRLEIGDRIESVVLF